MKVTIGGQRLGSGNKMQTDLHNYGRSTHNLRESFMSSMAPGVLYPFYCNVGLNGDTFDIDLDAMARTIPTQGPLMASFKLQLDMFQCPIRLYQGMLHNNKMSIGMQMQNVMLPQLHITTNPVSKTTDESTEQIANSALLKYLGLSGLGTPANGDGDGYLYLKRAINAVPVLSYYDIFKNYYANKQEDNAYVLTAKNIQEIAPSLSKAQITYLRGALPPETIDWTEEGTQMFYKDKGGYMTFTGSHLSPDNIEIWDDAKSEIIGTIKEIAEQGSANLRMTIDKSTESEIIVSFQPLATKELYFALGTSKLTKGDIALEEFPLNNIDDMRERILKETTLGVPFTIAQSPDENTDLNDILPYGVLCRTTPEGKTYNSFALNGLCVKTYQSDMFNAWVQTDWITGANGIAAITAIDTSSGSFNLDTLNLAQKVYNMLNRIAVSGGTYEDWQEAVYSQNAIRHAETPIYMGGMSSEIVFEEVISTAATNEDALGSLAGKGKLLGQKGGKLHFEVREPSIIMGIVSITPRVTYTQGNAWYLTDLFSMDDLHKPALDGIGFQDLIGEQLAWWDTKIDDSNGMPISRSTIGKVPAWINYMSAVDKAYGDFADVDGKNFMILDRRYDRVKDENGLDIIGDVTTYIDPSKYNYAFAYKDLSAQNFWLQIVTNVRARRIMSAKIIPTL